MTTSEIRHRHAQVKGLVGKPEQLTEAMLLILDLLVESHCEPEVSQQWIIDDATGHPKPLPCPSSYNTQRDWEEQMRTPPPHSAMAALNGRGIHTEPPREHVEYGPLCERVSSVPMSKRL